MNVLGQTLLFAHPINIHFLVFLINRTPHPRRPSLCWQCVWQNGQLLQAPLQLGVAMWLRCKKSTGWGFQERSCYYYKKGQSHPGCAFRPPEKERRGACLPVQARAALGRRGSRGQRQRAQPWAPQLQTPCYFRKTNSLLKSRGPGCLLLWLNGLIMTSHSCLNVYFTDFFYLLRNLMCKELQTIMCNT